MYVCMHDFLKNKEIGIERNTCLKKRLKILYKQTICMERMKTTQITGNLMQLKLKLENLKETMTKLAFNKKNFSKSFYAYGVRAKVEALENSAGNMTSQGFLMAENLNGYFSSVFTREDISSLPVPDAKFQEVKSEYLGQLIVTTEMVAKKIKAMRNNKSPGVDGIPPSLLMETVQQVSIPFARVATCNLLLKEGVVPFKWKETNIISLF